MTTTRSTVTFGQSLVIDWRLANVQRHWLKSTVSANGERNGSSSGDASLIQWTAHKDTTALSRTDLLQWSRKPYQENIRHRSLAYRNALADTAIAGFAVFFSNFFSGLALACPSLEELYT